MKRELGIARCGLACCLCSENATCKGCKRDGFMELSWCKDAEWCENRKCVIEKNLLGCYECTPAECRKGLYAEKIKAKAFAESHIDMALMNYLTAWNGMSRQGSSAIVKGSWEITMNLMFWRY